MGDERIAILGGGVIGMTTGVALALAGYENVILTAQTVGGHQAAPPEFASLHAAASVLPHSVRGSEVPALMVRSQRAFEALAFAADCGVRRQTHYEVYETDHVASPSYAPVVQGFQRLDASSAAEGPSVPWRPGAAVVSGWRFDSYFCEAPRYLTFLDTLYRALGGRIVEGIDVTAPGMPTRIFDTHNVIVNCLGAIAPTFLARAVAEGVRDSPGDNWEPMVDSWGMRTIRGHYLKVRVGEALTDDAGRFISYNYTPTPDVYADADGNPADLYCYPRSDAWILGGSRQMQMEPCLPGDPWTGGQSASSGRDFVTMDGSPLRVPEPILSVNAEILAAMTGGRIDLARVAEHDPASLTAGIGYRSERAHPQESIRVGLSRALAQRETHVVHNYGHGGAGFTLSWGCAAHVLQLLSRVRHTPQSAHHPLSISLESTAEMLRDVMTLETPSAPHITATAPSLTTPADGTDSREDTR